jgi:hypothetical protein
LRYYYLSFICGDGHGQSGSQLGPLVFCSFLLPNPYSCVISMNWSIGSYVIGFQRQCWQWQIIFYKTNELTPNPWNPNAIKEWKRWCYTVASLLFVVRSFICLFICLWCNICTMHYVVRKTIKTVILDKNDVQFCHEKQIVGWNNMKIVLHSNMENY